MDHDNSDSDEIESENSESTPSRETRPAMTQSQFLNSAAIFEGGLLVVALSLGWLVGTDPTEKLFWSGIDFGFGILATVPMLLMLAVFYLLPSAGLQSIRTFLHDSIAPYLDRCRLIDLFFLALLAGVCEEIFFRGLLYFWIAPFNSMLAILICNLLFGIAHAVTPLYAMIAGLIGLYLTALVAAAPAPNLLIPITAHTAYDFVAFLVVVYDYRRQQSE